MTHKTLLDRYLELLRGRAVAQHDLLDRLAIVEHLAPRITTSAQVARCLRIELQLFNEILALTDVSVIQIDEVFPLTSARLDALENSLVAIRTDVLVRGTELKLEGGLRGVNQVRVGRLDKLAAMANGLFALSMAAWEILDAPQALATAGAIGRLFFDFTVTAGATSDQQVEWAEQLQGAV